MSDAPGRIVPSCVEALENYRQADMDGIMVLASRQAIHETIDAYWARVKTCEELEAKLTKAVEALWSVVLDSKCRLDSRTYTKCSAVIAEINGGGDE